MVGLEQSGHDMCRLWALLGQGKGTSRTSPGHCTGYMAAGLSPTHCLQLSGTPSPAPLQEPPPTLPSHCCRCVGSRNLITEQQGAQQTWGQGCLQASLLWVLSDGTAHTSLAPSCAQRSSAMGLDRHRPCSAESMASTLPSLSQPTPQAVVIKDMQHINKNSWDF